MLEQAADPTHRGLFAARALALAAGVALFFATGNPMLVAAVTYLWAGRHSLQSALWLRSADPDRDRAAACYWFFLATAAWKAAVSAFGSVIGFVAMAEMTGVEPHMPTFAVTMITITAGVVLAAILGGVGVRKAMRRGVRVFVVPEFRALCAADFTMAPRVAVDLPRRFNFAIFVLTASLVVPPLFAGGGLMIWAGAHMQPNDPQTVFAIAGFALLVGGPLATIPVYARCSRRIIARHPSECWGPF